MLGGEYASGDRFHVVSRIFTARTELLTRIFQVTVLAESGAICISARTGHKLEEN
jgi:hypothetical protein